MAWTSPSYSRERVNQAGRIYVDLSADSENRELALTVINNWRSSHSFPLNTMQMYLRRRATHYDSDATIAQRIKRLPSIRHKLERYSDMRLARMQDIGGCRAVLASVKKVDQLVAYYKQESRIKHRLVREDPYILEPPASGYRGVHLVYSYYSDRSDLWNGLRIELQIRSRLQHAWATAVETVGIFTQQALKSSLGEEQWLRFFALMSSALALREHTPLVPDTPTNETTLVREIRRYARDLDVISRLSAYGQTLRIAEQTIGTEKKKSHSLLLELDIEKQTLTTRSYTNPLVAAEEYSALERAIGDNPKKDVVLVSVESLDALRRAYPNYFLDTSAFLETVSEAIQ